ncbi:MAG: DUF4129 domain-containing protein [Acaryochloris sp. SU_5_25]|nr:DUF4129 domain-containing protein [Acaryochloris sp. SU_5_25]
MATIPLISIVSQTVSQFDQTSWRVENGIRQTGEWVEWQWQRLGDWVWGNESTAVNAPVWWGDILLWLARGLAVLMLLWIVYRLFQTLKGGWRWLSQRNPRNNACSRPLRTEVTTVQDWLTQAAQAQGDYPAACRALYMALLLRLEETGWLYGNRTHTDQEYLQRLESQWILKAKPTGLQATWRRIFQVHEVSYYGAAPVAAETFQACQQAYHTLDAELNQPEEGSPSP